MAGVMPLQSIVNQTFQNATSNHETTHSGKSLPSCLTLCTKSALYSFFDILARVASTDIKYLYSMKQSSWLQFSSFYTFRSFYSGQQLIVIYAMQY